ncbi:uncharacterized protein LOC132553184 [Ylistrum balloti]|uniref:uncharacterized protein LOC132553184 n=1 Tax=Ylistrum balloti TaxID=509963 RepID=UPI002905D1A7|nr:uncharacterized protein LOC132553184 [Ylistrum balloti]
MAAKGNTDENERMSVLLSRLLDRKVIGTPEVVDIKRRIWPIQEYIGNSSNEFEDLTYGGSQPEGIVMQGTDLDILRTDKNVVVLYRGQEIPRDCEHKTILYMKEAGCRSGYATLQLGNFGEMVTEKLSKSLVSFDGELYVSSDIYREQNVKIFTETTGMKAESHGPSSILSEMPFPTDHVYSFRCNSFPEGANEWINRTRLYGWPSQSLTDKIVNGGCHLVPVGDTCSGDTLLQWRVSLITAERQLVHSLNHTQFQVYCLLKYFLKQIQDSIEKMTSDRDILCSYFMKTLTFFAVENTHPMFWQEKNLFYCFWFCFNMLISWVRLGHCPNYFFKANNMFEKKVHGQNQQKLLQILDHCQKLKWMSLAVGTYFDPSIMEYLRYARVQAELGRPQTLAKIEHDKDIEILDGLKWCRRMFLYRNSLVSPMSSMLKSQTEVDDLITYYSTVCTLLTVAVESYPNPETSTGNKTRYKSLKKCRQWLIPASSFGTELLYLATFHFKTGNYKKALEICNGILLLKTFDIDDETRIPPEKQEMHAHAFCGQGYTLVDRIRKIFTCNLFFKDRHFCLHHFEPELSKCSRGLYIPSLPYAVFLSFLCFHELEDRTGCDAALHNLIMVKYDDQQGGHRHWIVHTLLGICYQTLGDTQRAKRAYLESHQTRTFFHELNPALERIESLRSD